MIIGKMGAKWYISGTLPYWTAPREMEIGKRPHFLRALAELTKFRITLLSTLSAATGYVIYSRRIEAGIVTCAAGVMLAAMGACALNQCQDRKLDALMERTRSRPLPGGILSLRRALAVSVLLMSAGFILLWTAHNRDAALAALEIGVGPTEVELIS